MELYDVRSWAVGPALALNTRCSFAPNSIIGAADENGSPDLARSLMVICFGIGMAVGSCFLTFFRVQDKKGLFMIVGVEFISAVCLLLDFIFHWVASFDSAAGYWFMFGWYATHGVCVGMITSNLSFMYFNSPDMHPEMADMAASMYLLHFLENVSLFWGMVWNYACFIE